METVTGCVCAYRELGVMNHFIPVTVFNPHSHMSQKGE